ncbi:hypothetical protein CC85DRAFT_6081 [Cutaneotrichosporon oleaginosum]|uniref:Uncharacterized protein n=1 Tax=Cutaneotrichosporon oleaginosum TaxID=879819 RepID=A0A0J0XZX0_9TREE|nr:uncharacterized protein CC85DRAFT_6081 [Cutaneotrichosporon oleaginosum]KLT46566.1 hypothetical protein CC85DRAFT_6081 [Cutaneotrichosporon oleaginosum]TXT15069.1 hypothetical protein COLE_01262 [Cutaneotrichosporon oleaginosum]
MAPFRPPSGPREKKSSRCPPFPFPCRQRPHAKASSSMAIITPQEAVVDIAWSVLTTGRSAAGRLAGMQLRTPNKGEAARRAALSSPCYDASFATTPSQPSGRGTSSDRSDSRARTPGEIGSVTPKTPSTVRHYDSSCRTPQQEARYAALQAGLNPDRNFPRRAILRPRCEAALY